MALHVVQQMRDEAHRFAISGHRAKRGRVGPTSPLEGIPGVGAIRRRALLRHFGGLRQVRSAGIEIFYGYLASAGRLHSVCTTTSIRDN
ncbi:MAG: hypothetical protein CM1200mP41_35380 [Gammaproteobacteria bacterium]|nr:MAG: hypothetical protein CM1200mP41_35380 [Gammaproteobacteria bacterium]